MLRMPSEYDQGYDRLLGDVAAAASDPDARITPFWPIAGWNYDGSLMVIGRSVNGWIDDRRLGDLAHPAIRSDVIRTMRQDAEREVRCRMLWVTDMAGSVGHYNTNNSAFWRVQRQFVRDLGIPNDANWPSSIAWTNLYKVAPAGGWNPGAELARAQRSAAAELLSLELNSLRPRRLLAMTGHGWMWHFLEPLGLELELRTGLVEGVGRLGETSVVVAKHPMTKPHNAYVEEVRGAFNDLGAPLVGDESTVVR